ncbi:hypothetical protein BT96DRAFT_1101489 [Gymnopus androsaceus JB14]|uniref:DUF6534 domain-containing protein n=1 Tax=Gymnopus androsaceus JB14 TaxID=1447944 RepID=A0A6A4HPY3_9AGAR|nr:hypothetical protein BT96DRAFT_1101489 [Gymnopus androsaceus JB14]
MASTTVPTGIAIPSLNNTLGALFIGSSFATVSDYFCFIFLWLYGVTCVQTFLYLTSRRSQVDSWAVTCFVLVVLPWIQCINASTPLGYIDVSLPIFSTLLRLPMEVQTVPQSSLLWMRVLLVFFCFRLWVISATAYKKLVRIALVALALALSILNCGNYTRGRIWWAAFLMYYNFSQQHIKTALAWKLVTASGMVLDTIITTALTSSLYRARSGIKKSNHVINLIIIGTVNTNLITTLLALAQLITFVALPSADYYGAIVLVLPKSYINCFLATLNYRDYLQKKLHDNTPSNLVTLKSMNARLGSSHSTPSTMNFRDGIEMHVVSKSNTMAV